MYNVQYIQSAPVHYNEPYVPAEGGDGLGYLEAGQLPHLITKPNIFKGCGKRVYKSDPVIGD